MDFVLFRDEHYQNESSTLKELVFLCRYIINFITFDSHKKWKCANRMQNANHFSKCACHSKVIKDTVPEICTRHFQFFLSNLKLTFRYKAYCSMEQQNNPFFKSNCSINFLM